MTARSGALACVGLAALAACSPQPGAGGTGSAGSAGSAGLAGSGTGSAAAAEKPRATCLDLPGAPRAALQISKDKKTLYYIETILPKTGTIGDATRDLYAVDLATHAARVVVPNVIDAFVTSGGPVVFRRFGKKDALGQPTAQLYLAQPGKDPVLVSDDTLTVGRFVVDDTNGVVAFMAGSYSADRAYRMPLATGKAALAAEGVFGILAPMPADRSFLVSTVGGVARLGDDAGSATPLPGIDHATFADAWIVADVNGTLLLKERVTKRLSLTTLAAPKTLAPLAVDAEDLEALDDRTPSVLVGTVGAERAHAYKLFAFDGQAAPPIAAVSGIRPTGAVALADGTWAVLAVNDTDGDGVLDDDEEADVCLLPADAATLPVAIASRTIPKRFVDVARQLAPLMATGGIVAGAALRFAGDAAVFTVATGPADLAGLRKLASATQDAVTRASGQPTLSVEIVVTAGARIASSRWDASTGTFRVSAGIGIAQVVDPAQYELEVDPHVTLTTQDTYAGGDADFGSVRCFGTIKNVGPRELADLAVECHNETEYVESKPVKASVVPAKLAVGATGKYSVTLDVAQGSRPTTLVMYTGAARIGFINVFAQREAAALVDVAVKLQASTKLAYWSDRVVEVGPSYRHHRAVAYQVVLPEDLDKPDASAARTAAAAAAYELLAAYNKTAPNDKDLGVVVVLLHPNRRIGWTYDQSALHDGGPDHVM